MKPKKLVFGVGINDADYVVQRKETLGYVDGKQKQVWSCPFYRTWANMLKRCSEKWQKRYPTYRGCSVAVEWLTFSVFKGWMEKQEWEGLQMDKDLLIVGNKVYDPERCIFVTQMVNTFVNDRGASRGEWLIGVCWDKDREKFRAYCKTLSPKNWNTSGYSLANKKHMKLGGNARIH